MRLDIPKSIDQNIEQFNGLDAESFSSLFRKYYEPLYFFAGRFVKDPSAAESVVQDVFVKLWKNKNSLNINFSIKAYLYTSVKNTCLNLIKKENFFSSITEEEHLEAHNVGETIDRRIEENEINSEIHRAINMLPEKCRQIFVMCRFDNLSYDEIAEIQNVSVNTVKTQLKRAMNKLSKSLAHLRSVIISVQLLVWWYLGK